MLYLLKNYSPKALSYKFILLYILNCTDILFTYTLLKTGLFYEANFIMTSIVTDPYLSFLVKILIPLVLIIRLIPRLPILTSTSLMLCNVALTFILAIYLFINSTHLYYLFLFITA